MSKRELIQRLRERIKAGGGVNYYQTAEYADDTISADDIESLLTYSNRLDLHDYSDSRHEKMLRHTVRIAEGVGGLTEALEDRDAAEAIVRWINCNEEGDQTKCDYRLAVRLFGKLLLRRGPKGDPPESIAWMSGNTPKDYDPKPMPADMLAWEDHVLLMINEGTDNTRNKALFAVQFEGGFRPCCELYEMRVGDVKDVEYGVEIEVDGKTGQRSVTLILAIPYLNRWLGDHHPCPADDDAYLWVKSNGERMSYTTFSRYFKRAGRRIGLEKPVTPENFRKSNATWLATLGKNESFIEDRQGRERGSDAIAHYVAMYGEDRTREYAAMHGQEVETEDPQDYTPITCPRCGKQTPQDKEICMWCNQALNHDTFEDLEETRSTVENIALRLFQQDNEFVEEVVTRKEISRLLVEDEEFFQQALDLASDIGDIEMSRAME